ncbi:hypothetical protein CTAM01_17238 [Colletotrichum tamarilloi]|uniref:Uncharacterized protein n=1 Tax=Colletotrichum tamarilloi TaxID=1209934 RepID=A0ABQ9QG71_9PEZI|nr:uncharacterized protein CTAM01_17238 [Colletotrichum tamarilloi]KAK1454226.1 hypothetical protein CTAM01_17238 [Colletotrichum tamarilloi]
MVDCCFYAVIGCVLEKPTPFPGPRPGLGGLVSHKAAGANSISLPTALRKNRKNGHHCTGRRTAKNGSGSKHLDRLGATQDGLHPHYRGTWRALGFVNHHSSHHTACKVRSQSRPPTGLASWRLKSTDSR